MLAGLFDFDPLLMLHVNNFCMQSSGILFFPSQAPIKPPTMQALVSVSPPSNNVSLIAY